MFIVKGLPGEPGLTFEQDVKVTTVTEHDVPVKVGDVVEMVVRGKVSRIAGGALPEVELSNLTAAKVVGVKRG